MSLIVSLWVWMAGRKDPHGRPWLTVLSFGVLLSLPVFSLLPKLRLELLGFAGASSGQGGSWSWLLIIWLLGIVLMLARVLYGQSVLRRWVNESDQVNDESWGGFIKECKGMLGMKKTPAIRTKKGLASPVVAGLIHPVILVPVKAGQWSEKTRKMVLLHEMGHIARKDLWIRMAAEITCAVHWYNPLVWWMRAKLLTQCEYACDARVIESGANPRTYIRALCDVVEWANRECPAQQKKNHQHLHGVAAMVDHAPLKMRVNRLLGSRRLGQSWLAIVAAMITTVTALGLSFIRPAADTADGDTTNRYNQLEINLRHSANPFPGN